MENINEGYLNQVFMGLYDFPNRETDTAKIIKAHKYDWYLRLIDHTNDLNDLLYIRKDLNYGMQYYDLLEERIELCTRYGDCPKTHKYYKGIKKKFIDKGVTPKDCQLIKKWFEDEARPVLNQKIKEARKAQVESVTFISSSLTDLNIV